ncbi:MAG: CDP-glucose 4,6-dehydratase [Bacteroidia bacterium]
MESMVNIKKLFGGIYEGKKVLVTGHTGFKGSWLVQWLELLGADVFGYSLVSSSTPNHFSLLNLEMKTKEGDIRDLEKFSAFINQVQPDIVFHLAAQALVRASYANPLETFSTNVMGTLNVYEACRKTNSVVAIVNVTSDKCYENKEWMWGYRENDSMGGFDPYSASKGCSELLTSSYRNSFFNLQEYKKSHNVLISSVRAGNVVGGGDWAIDRLIPDIIKAASENTSVNIRNPKATRPWQHVLEPLSGYLTVGWKLLEEEKEFANGWNFGPDMNSNLSVEEVINISKNYWENVHAIYSTNLNDHHEANLLMLDCSKANKLLKWKPVWGIEDTIEKTIEWYKHFYYMNEIKTKSNLFEYINNAKKMKLIWAS